MTTQANKIKYKSYISIMSIFVGLVALLVITGYIFHIEALKSIVPFWLEMKANTAILFVLTAVALWFLGEDYLNRAQTFFIYLLGFVMLVFSLLTFYEYLFNVSFGIGEMFFYSTKKIDDILFPGRTSVATTTCLFLLSLALLTVNNKLVKVWFFQIPICLVLFLGFFSLLQYFYNISSFYKITYFTKMALNTVVCFIVISIAVLLSKPQVGITKILFSDTAGGLSARTLIPSVTIILVFVGFLENIGEHFEMYGADFGDNIQITVSIILISLVIILNALQINRYIKQKQHEK